MVHSTLSFSDRQIAELAKRGLTPETLRPGAVSVATEADLPPGAPDYWTVANGILPAVLFPWRSPMSGSGPGELGPAMEWQARPDEPVLKPNGDTAKYVFRKGARSILHAAKVVADPYLVLITEGTCQSDMAALHAPDSVAVYGIAGCQSWMKAGVVTSDLQVVAGRDVMIVLDTDAGSNRNVFDAGLKLREACLAEGARSVRFIRVPGGGKAGLDDYLAGRGGADRAGEALANLIGVTASGPKAMEKPADRRPEAKAERPVDEDGNPVGSGRFFDPVSGGLLVETLSNTVREMYPSALTAEDKVAVYRDGVYGIDGTAFLSTVTGLLRERFAAGHLHNAELFTVGQLAAEGARLPHRIMDPVLNVANGMLDLRTGELHPHAPEFMSTAQLAVEWDPDAVAPIYEAWLKDSIGAQGDDLEEAASAMLDPSTTPAKALFLFGPSRSGKSTFLRLLEAVAGPGNTSGVSLHQLVENRFMAANVYGKTLNISADLSAAHIDDISIFKMMTGEDLIQADRKYGHQFAFTNRALFAFSANEPPTVGESSRAYSERVKPFLFGNSFAGREDASIEAAMLTELPGILARWVAAWRRRQERGSALASDPAVRHAFEIASDRVRQFIAARYRIGGEEAFSTTAEIHIAFREWAQDEGRQAMGRTKMAARLRSIPGVESVQSLHNRARGWNLTLLARQDWDQDKTDTGTGTEVRDGDKTDMARAESADFSLKKQVGEPNVFQDHPQEIGASEIASYGQTQHTLHRAESDDSSQVDDILTLHSLNQYRSSCPDCGTTEVLIDGLWFACPRCHPATVR